MPIMNFIIQIYQETFTTAFKVRVSFQPVNKFHIGGIVLMERTYDDRVP